MSNIMLDSSAVIALLKPEAGSGVVASSLPGAALSAVNLAEVVTWMRQRGDTLEAIHWTLDMLNLNTVGFDHDLAVGTGILVDETKKYGLSLGDRACLATAAREGVPVLTAERSWSNLSLGIAIQLIR
jgi:PIN domain nuclease of toxin-antitoxin system